jgi:hypothetical protein
MVAISALLDDRTRLRRFAGIAYTGGTISLPGPGLSLSLPDLCRGLTCVTA